MSSSFTQTIHFVFFNTAVASLVATAVSACRMTESKEYQCAGSQISKQTLERLLALRKKGICPRTLFFSFHRLGGNDRLGRWSRTVKWRCFANYVSVVAASFLHRGAHLHDWVRCGVGTGSVGSSYGCFAAFSTRDRSSWTRIISGGFRPSALRSLHRGALSNPCAASNTAIMS